MSDGRAIPVTTKVVVGGESKLIYYARFDDRIEAKEAVRKYPGKTSEIILEERTLLRGGYLRK